MSVPGSSLRDQGIQALQAGEVDKAVDLLARAVMADDSDGDAKAMLGIAYAQKGLHAQAKRALQTAIELQPENANYRFNLGVALERAGDLPGAAVAYRDTLQLNKDHGQARAKLQAMGPQVHQWLAQAPKPVDPVGVPTYNTPQQQAAAAPPGAPGGAPGYATPAYSSGSSLDEGPPGTVQCPNCRQWSKPGLVCEFCASTMPPPARMEAPAPMHGPGMMGGQARYVARAPHRGGLVLTMGILGVLVCGVCAIAAWIMGKKDLAEMDAGAMDDSGRSLTQTGMIFGIIGVVFIVIQIITIVAVLLPVILAASRGGG